MQNKRPSSLFRKPGLLAGLSMLALAILSCSAPGLAATATPLPSPTALPPQASPTPLPPTATPLPSSTPLPTATGTPAPTNIVFYSGTTAGVVQGTVQPGQVLAFNLSASAYQPMILILTSGKGDAYLGVAEPNGNLLLDPAKKWSNWQWLLPKTEVNTISVYGGSVTQDFILTAKVAQRVTFQSGATSITLSGTTQKGYVFSYALAAKKGQKMTLTLSKPASSAYLDVIGLATGVLLTPASKSNTWTGILPADEDYIIEVIPAGGLVVNYSLKVEVK